MHYSLKRATMWNIAGYIYLLVVSFLTTPGLIAALGLTDFGRYALAMGIAAIVSSLDLGLYRSLVYHLAAAKKDSDRTILRATTLWLYAGIAAIAGTIVWYYWGASVGLFVVMTFLLSHTQAYWESRGDFGKVNIRSFAVGTANTVGALAIARAGGGVDGIIHGLTLTTFFVLIYLRPLVKMIFDRQVAKKVLAYGMGNQLGKLMGQVQGQYAKFLFAGNALSLSAYSVASSVVSRAVGGVTQASTALFPRGVTTGDTPSYRRLYYRIQGGLACLGVVAIVLYGAVGEPLVYWWLNNPQLAAEVHRFLTVYRWYAGLLLLTPLASTTVDAMGKPAVTSFFGFAAVAVEVVFSITMYRQIGIVAPAYGALLSLVIFVPVFLWVTEKILSHGEKSVH